MSSVNDTEMTEGRVNTFESRLIEERKNRSEF